jgi:hypothetical protein
MAISLVKHELIVVQSVVFILHRMVKYDVAVHLWNWEGMWYCKANNSEYHMSLL